MCGDQKKPNIVFILTDDQGNWAMGCAGNKDIRTPNLDRLTYTGTRFDNFFCTSPVCSPARASILTGRIPSQHGVHDWIVGGNGPNDWMKIGGTGRNTEYLDGMTAYTDILSKNGYVCGISGKWHMGYSWKPQKSFDHWFVFENAANSYYHADMIRDGKPEKTEGYLTNIITDDALKFIKEHGNGPKPFYLSVHYNAPHRPWKNNHPQEIVESYDECTFKSVPQEPDHRWTYLNEREMDDPRENLKHYYASITAMDQDVGRILDKLEEMGLREDTLVCFVSDNGFNCGQHGIWGKGNGTFPINMYDTSVKVPGIFSWPGVVRRGTVSDALVSQYDIMPTLLECAGAENPEKENLPGRSFLQILTGEQNDFRDNVVVFDEYGPVRMIRTKEWKYVHRYPYGPNELYDLNNDPDERNNLFSDDKKKAKISELRGELEEFFLKYVDPTLDGSKQPITGWGQRDIVGPGRHAFNHRKKDGSIAEYPYVEFEGNKY